MAVDSTEGQAQMSGRELLRWRAFRAVLRMRQWSALPTASRRSLPDFLIVGGQRCGTTSLYRYLDQHPSVMFPRLTKGTQTLLGNLSRANGVFQLTLVGPSAARFEILGAQDIALPAAQLTSLATLTNTTGTVSFKDPAATVPYRFYRARQLP